MNVISKAPYLFGEHLKDWRRRRRISQLDFALEAGISQKHLSFIETGRSRPSQEMVIHLAESLGVPLRERNTLLLAAGHAPLYSIRDLDHPSLASAREAINLLLQGHEPFPALALDRHWSMIAANAAVMPLLAGVTDSRLLEPPINVLRLSLHPKGLAPHILNLAQWRKHLLDRLKHQIDVAADQTLVALMGELSAYPCPSGQSSVNEASDGGVLIPLQLASPMGELSLLSTTTLFGTPLDVTLSEVVVESFFPVDDHSRGLLLGLSPGRA